MKSAVVISLLACVAFSGKSLADWRLVYHNDKEGNVLSGSLCELKAVAESGYSIKVGLTGNNGVMDSVSTTPVMMIHPLDTVIVDKDKVTGVIEHIGLTTNNSGHFAVTHNAYTYMRHQIVDTTGFNASKTIYHHTNKKLSPYSYDYDMKWFADAPRPVFGVLENECD